MIRTINNTGQVKYLCDSTGAFFDIKEAVDLASKYGIFYDKETPGDPRNFMFSELSQVACINNEIGILIEHETDIYDYHDVEITELEEKIQEDFIQHSYAYNPFNEIISYISKPIYQLYIENFSFNSEKKMHDLNLDMEFMILKGSGVTFYGSISNCAFIPLIETEDGFFLKGNIDFKIEFEKIENILSSNAIDPIPLYLERLDKVALSNRKLKESPEEVYPSITM